MPSRKKNKSGGGGGGGGAAPRPIPTHSDSLVHDIEAAQSKNLEAISSRESGGAEDDYDAEEGLDIADQLLATLDARDRAANKVAKASIDEERAQDGGEQHLRVGSSSSTDMRRSGSSPLKHMGEKLMHAGERVFGHHDAHKASGAKSPDTSTAHLSPAADGDVDANLATAMQRKGSIRRLFSPGSPSSKTAALPANGGGEGAVVDADSTEQTGGGGKRKISRQKARLERKAAEMEAQRVQAEEELKANGGKPDEAQRERVAITELCAALGVEMKEINPDGHCLYAAIADQLNILGKKSPSGANLDYHDTRKATAEYMRTHAKDFMPFISDSDEHMAGIENKEAGTSPDAPDAARLQEKYFMGYCDAVESTGVWGGQPEILALSRAFHTPIHVVQAGCPVVKVGTDEAQHGKSDDEALMISYHRHMYGLGEHYNSLHKRRA